MYTVGHNTRPGIKVRIWKVSVVVVLKVCRSILPESLRMLTDIGSNRMQLSSVTAAVICFV
jgi:hypothetical protein